MDDWGTTTTHRIGKNVAETRKRKKMSAQTLADLCEARGIPMKRTSIANLENGRRDSVTVTDLMAIAAALEVPPVTLMFPTDQAGLEVEVLPNNSAMTFDALTWFTGETTITPGDPDIEVSLLINLRSIRAAENKARRFIRQPMGNPPSEELQATLRDHAVWALKESLPYREACERLLNHPLPIPDDLVGLYGRAELDRSSVPGGL
ncbi:helix-turn-helix domain-containing protein [Kocuria sp. M4R2S49]|uniref:helix-turn-helix domain-containing protein n=1 Tax=Kocuria rhizosphaericola TaxID=3376284 RepID=UPI0037B0F008